MSIQDDYFDVSDHLKKNGPEWASEAFERIWGWGVDCENENEKLRPIVSSMKNAVSLMFEQREKDETVS